MFSKTKNLITKFKKTIIGFVIGGTALAVGLGALPSNVPVDLQLKAPIAQVLNPRETDWIEYIKDAQGNLTNKTENRGRIMKYDYITANEVSGEFVFNKGSYTNAKILSQRIDEKGRIEKTVAFYSGDHFYKSPSGKVFEIEHGATTTIQAYNSQIGFLGKIKKIVSQTALAVDIYSGAGDGQVKNNPGSTNWATVHDATNGSAFDSTGTIANAMVDKDVANFEITRTFFPTDTSSLGAGATITAATFKGYVIGVYNADDDGDDWINVVQTSQASNTVLATEDYDQCGAVSNPTEGATRIDYTGLATSAYTTWTLNATGLTWINPTGYTLIGLREGHDAINSAFAGANNTNDGIQINTSEQTGTANDPYMTITYTAAPAAGEEYIINFE